MNARLGSLVPLALSLAASAPGCLAHERPEPGPNDAAVLVDAASVDAGMAGDAAPPDAWAECVWDDTSIGVRIEAVTADTARCVFTHADGASLWGVDADPVEQGIRLHFDLCPAADADCRCDVVVSHVGADLASALGPEPSVTIDLEEGTDFTGPFVAITKTPTCECVGCGCALPLYFYAASANPDAAPSVPAPLAFSLGAPVCPMRDCSFGGSYALHARADGDVEVRGAETRDLGAVHVRAVRDVEVYEPCAACAGCATPIGAWAAWVTSL